MYEQRLAIVEAKAAELQRHRSELVERIAHLRAEAADTEGFAQLPRSDA
ncbi:hypothetical protein AB0O76_17745 [Streptomyces sp. NPDC086554]